MVPRKLFRTRDGIKDPWIIYAAKWRDTIYMRVDKKATLHIMRNETQMRMSSWGHKFEQYLVTDSPDKSPNTLKAVVEPDEFRCVFNRRFGEHTVLYASEMDAFLSEAKLEDPLPMKNLKFVELKTTRMIKHGGHKRTLRRLKFEKWWCQGFLSPTEADDRGMVHELKDYSIAELAKCCDPWDPKACANFCASMLTKISKAVISDCDETIYKFERLSNANSIYITQLPASSENEVIPKSYRDATE